MHFFLFVKNIFKCKRYIYLKICMKCPISTGLRYNIYQRTDVIVIFDIYIGIFKEATILTDNIETPEGKTLKFAETANTGGHW